MTFGLRIRNWLCSAALSSCPPVVTEGSKARPHCLSGEELAYASVAPASQVCFCFLHVSCCEVYFRGRISNWLTCTNTFVLSMRVGYGVHEATLTVGDLKHTIFSRTQAALGVRPFVMCCKVWLVAHTYWSWPRSCWRKQAPTGMDHSA